MRTAARTSPGRTNSGNGFPTGTYPAIRLRRLRRLRDKARSQRQPRLLHVPRRRGYRRGPRHRHRCRRQRLCHGPHGLGERLSHRHRSAATATAASTPSSSSSTSTVPWSTPPFSAAAARTRATASPWTRTATCMSRAAPTPPAGFPPARRSLTITGISTRSW